MSKKKIELTPHQQHAFNRMVEFIRNKSLQVFILKGYAGTGKENAKRPEPYHSGC